MAEVTMYAKPMQTAPQAGGLGSVVRLVVRQFLEQKHYRQLHRTLSDQWCNCHSLTAAVKLMEAHGVRITPEQEAKFAEMSEDRMIEALVAKMPQQSREQFEHFFLQLSFIASTTTRLRAALESGQPEVVEEALESAENVGVLPHLIKMAIGQAGQEVKSSSTDHDAWLGETEAKMTPLLQAASACMAMQKELEQAKSLLTTYKDDSRDKAKSVLLGMADGNEKALLGSVVSAWGAISQRAKREAEIRQEYEAEIIAANERLFAYKHKALANVKKVLQRTAAESEGKVILSCLAALKKEANEVRTKERLAAETAEITAKSKECAAAMKEKAHNVLMSINASTDTGILQNAMAAWKVATEEVRQEKKSEAKVQEAQAKVQEFMKKQNAGAQSVLTRMCQSSESAILEMSITGWKEVVAEEKKTAVMEAELNAKTSKMNIFSAHNKCTSMTATQRAAYLQDYQMLVFVWTTWKREHRIEAMRAYGKEKNEKRKRELIGVKGLFKDFAGSLEATLQSGTPRVEDIKARSRKSGGTRALATDGA